MPLSLWTALSEAAIRPYCSLLIIWIKCYFLHLSVGQEGLCATNTLQKFTVSSASESHAAFKIEENLDGNQRLVFSVE